MHVMDIQTGSGWVPEVSVCQYVLAGLAYLITVHFHSTQSLSALANQQSLKDWTHET